MGEMQSKEIHVKSNEKSNGNPSNAAGEGASTPTPPITPHSNWDVEASSSTFSRKLDSGAGVSDGGNGNDGGGNGNDGGSNGKVSSLSREHSPTNSCTRTDPKSAAATVQPGTNSSNNSELSEVEQIAERIEVQRANRVPITFQARKRFLRDCHRIAKQAGDRLGRISVADARRYRDQVTEECRQGVGWDNIAILKAFGFLCDVDCLLATLDRAVEVAEQKEGEWLYYRDFNFDHTRTVSRFPMFRDQLRVAILVVFLYYLFTPILFCHIMTESNICGGTDGDQYRGWVSALYFASTTMSTVGYGDLTVSQDPVWRSFVGSMYMLLSILVAAVAFTAAASVTLSPLAGVLHKIFQHMDSRPDEEQFLYERIRRIRIIKITEIASQILLFLGMGVLAARIAGRLENDPERQWNWMTSFYWAVQTTTTIGYGDLQQPFGLRYFNIAYLMLSTFMVGNAFGQLGSLQEQMREVRRQHAWNRRKITKRFIDEMQAYSHDDKVDQYEFLVSSLIMLGKISSDDIRPIMEKFRKLAGPKNYISVDDTFSEQIASSGLNVTERINEDALVDQKFTD